LAAGGELGLGLAVGEVEGVGRLAAGVDDGAADGDDVGAGAAEELWTAVDDGAGEPQAAPAMSTVRRSAPNRRDGRRVTRSLGICGYLSAICGRWFIPAPRPEESLVTGQGDGCVPGGVTAASGEQDPLSASTHLAPTRGGAAWHPASP
jgi:hypothetical protein